MIRPRLPHPAATLLTAAALALPGAGQEAVAFTFDGCQGQGVWTTDGVTHLTGGALPTFAEGPDFIDTLWCGGSPFPFVAATLTRTGGDLGGGVDYQLGGRPGEPFVLVPSFSTGPVPIGGSPTTPLVARVGPELEALWSSGVLDAAGQAAVSIPLPSLPQLKGLVLHAQWVGFSPQTLGLERLSNRAAVRLHDPSGAIASSSVELGRWGRHVATPLADGRVLLTGGTGGTGSPVVAESDRIEYYDPAKEIFYPADATLAEPRALHTATVLADGTVLIVGGYDAQGDPLFTVERFDPATGATTTVQPLPSPRAEHAATLLGDGRVLVVGGYPVATGGSVVPNDLTDDCWLFDPGTQTWSQGPKLPLPAVGVALVTLPDGDALAVGGLSFKETFNLGALDTTLRYEAAQDQWVPEGDLPAELGFAAAATLSNGLVVVAGGTEYAGTVPFPSARTATFDVTGTWTAGGTLAFPRSEPQLVETADGLVVGGGFSNGLAVGAYERAALDSGSWFVVGNSLVSRPGLRLAPVEGGERVLVTGFAGGFADAAAELIRP